MLWESVDEIKAYEISVKRNITALADEEKLKPERQFAYGYASYEYDVLNHADLKFILYVLKRWIKRAIKTKGQ